MQILRRTSQVIMWVLAAAGIASGLVWAATAAGVIKPLIVISGSMEPGIMTGDLVIDTKAPTSTVRVGDVVSLPSELTGNLVTHRIRSVEHSADGGYTISMKGDANAAEDALDYHVQDEVWMPRLQVPAAGGVIMRLTTPSVLLPTAAGMVGLLGILWLVPAPVPTRRRLRGRDAAGTA